MEAEARQSTWASSPADPASGGVLIVGAGFGGLAVARELEHAPFPVTVIDRHNYTLFQPLLYQVATAALAPSDVATPVRSLLRGARTRILMDEVTSVDAGRSQVRTASGLQIPFGFLVIATGSEPNYFGHHNWKDRAPTPKALDDALAVRQRALGAFERAEIVSDQSEVRALMTFIVVGGATGVEMAGALAELAKRTLPREFRRIKPAQARILLVEGGPGLLGGFSTPLRAYAEQKLSDLGVEVRLNTRIENIGESGVVAGGERIPARVVIWCAGVKATPAAAWLGIDASQHGSVPVLDDFSIAGHPNIFVVGDAADFHEGGGKNLPRLAAVAKQEGQYVGKLLLHRGRGSGAPSPFRYRDYGVMATIGRSAAVADLRGIQFKGGIAWVLWGIVHIYFLIGFRNRMLVLINWFWAWLTGNRGARLIVSSPSPYASDRAAAHQIPAGEQS